jgi:hypothetical protein
VARGPRTEEILGITNPARAQLWLLPTSLRIDSHRDTITCTAVAILRCLILVTHIVIGLSCRMKTRTPTLYRIYATMKKENHHLLLLSHLLLQSLLTPNILLHSSIHHLILTLDTTGSTLTTMLTLTSNNNLHRLSLLTLTRSSHNL